MIDKQIKMKLLEELMKEMDNKSSERLKKDDTVGVTKIESKEVPVEELPDSIADTIEEEIELEDDLEEELSDDEEVVEELDELFDEDEEYDLEEDYEEALEEDEEYEMEDEEDEDDMGLEIFRKLKELRKSTK